MFKFKYFETIQQDQAAPKPDGPDTGLDISELGTGPLSRITSWLFNKALLILFHVFREVWPNPQFGRLVVVTRYDDVKQVLSDSAAFQVPFGLEMKELAGGTDSVLGVDGTDHDLQNGILRQVLLPSDLSAILSETQRVAGLLVASSGGRIDVMKDLITRVATESCGKYLGLDIEDPDIFADWTMAVSALLFADPFGNKNTRRMALYGASRLRAVIDRAIERARKTPRPDTVLDRLVQLQSTNPAITDGLIRANIMGLATGFIPTTTLAAGKIFQELLSRPDVMRDAIAKAVADDKPGLERMCWEAARLSPALSPGQWRYARQGGVIAPGERREKRVGPNSVLMVATMSALRDRRTFPAPSEFRLDRTVPADLIFGDGPHRCLGAFFVMAQTAEIFAALLKQKNLRRSAGAAGRLESVGPFPRRLDMEFEPVASPATQTMIVICAPISSTVNLDRLRATVSNLGNPAGTQVAQTLQDTCIVHFASMSVVDLGDEQNPAHSLLLELNVDGSQDAALRTIAQAAQSWLAPIFSEAGYSASMPLVELLNRHTLDLQTRPWGATGLNFNGTPEFSVLDIAKQADLTAFAGDALTHYQLNHVGLGSRAMMALDYVRGFIRQDPRFVNYANNPSVPADERERVRALLSRGASFADFLVRPRRRRLRISEWTEKTGRAALWNFLTSRSSLSIAALPAVVAVVVGIVVYCTLTDASSHFIGRFLVAACTALLSTALLLAVIVGGFLALLRYYETKEVSDDREAKLAHIRAVAKSENHHGYVQNHFTAVTPLKSGWFRKLTLAFSLWGIRELVTYWFRPGFVLNMGTIHYAKWFRVPGTERFIFLANYDGSWESYLEDFVMKAHAGQSAAWSNGVGFPQTRYLIYDGAQDGDRFKRWVRRQQVVTALWYSRFPRLTTDQIRSNALVHDGLMRATTDTAARDWLDCFGSIPRPDYAIETDEVQSLVFRGLKTKPYTACAIVRFPSNGVDRKRWLGSLLSGGTEVGGNPHQATDNLQRVRVEPVMFGDPPFNAHAEYRPTATFVGLSSRGLEKLGLPPADGPYEGLATFPAAFNIGMANRDRILGDVGSSAPDHWLWADATPTPVAADAERAADAVILVYGTTHEQCREILAGHIANLGGNNNDVVLHVVETQPVIDNQVDHNHFGFRDGISQPVIKGTERFSKGALPRDMVEPGEFILGYRNNQGYFPPTVTVQAATDRKNSLPVTPANEYSRMPSFTPANKAATVRDFGRNGSFLVLRQLAQDVDGFTQFTETKAEELRQYEGSASIADGTVTPDWVAAKLMGRWRDGTPLVDNKPSATDNDFAYGRDDPQGLHCPFGAHTRRANPRDSLQPEDPAQQSITNRHRLLRRGRSYQAPATAGSGAEKGMLFVCLCADLDRQFEFVQQSWISSPVFHGLSDEPDPITAAADPTATSVFTIPTSSGSLKLSNMRSFVTVRGGGYFFMPSRSAIQYLINLQP